MHGSCLIDTQPKKFKPNVLHFNDQILKKLVH